MRISDWSSDVCSSDLRVSLFIEPDPLQLEAAAKLGAPVVELHTGAYCDAYLEAPDGERLRACLARLRKAADLAGALGLERSEERRVGTEWVSPGRSRWSTSH